MVSPDSQATACLPSGRNSTYRPVQISGTCSGFALEFEDETDSTTSHVEFVATYPKTGKKFSVEVKS
jgi:hypothetical protein